MIPICAFYSYISTYDKVILKVDYMRFIEVYWDKKFPACLFIVRDYMEFS